ncbi:MAG: hypothetical protein ACTSQH_00425, partial [Candidatus Hodarchaeales archaeon]
MSVDITIKDEGGLNVLPTVVRQTEGGASDIKAGDPVKLKSAGSQYVIGLATAEPVIGTTTQVMGIAKSDSDHTASADGTMEVHMAQTGVIYSAKATTPANIDTQAKLDALVNDRVKFDLTGTVYTVDENEGDADASGL